MSDLELKPSRDSVWTTLTNYLIVSVMAACAAFAIVQLGQHLVPVWNASYIPIYSFFVALEAAFSTRYMRYTRLPVRWYTARVLEAMVVFFATRSLLSLIRGPLSAAEADALRAYGDNELTALVVVVAIVWLLSGRPTRCLLDLESTDMSIEREALMAVSDEQTSARQSLISTILLTGLWMVGASAIIYLSLRNAGLEAAAAQQPVAHMLIFFVLGLILLSKSRLAILRSGWEWERIPLGRNLPTRWIGYSVIMLIVVALIAVVLPTRYPLGLLDTLRYLLSLIIGLAQIVWYAIVTAVTSLLSLLFPQIQRPNAPPNPPNLPPIAPQPDANVNALPPFLEFVGALIFWLVFLIVMAYLIRQLAQRHPGIAEALRRLPGWSLIGRLWQRVHDLFGALNARIAATLETRRRAAAASRSTSRPRRWINVRRLAPRQQVQFYYQALLRRSSERGLTRQPSQTPYEYARDLQSHLPEVEPDVAAITQEFIEARYSRHEITPEHVGLVRRCWASIKRALRRGKMKDAG